MIDGVSYCTLCDTHRWVGWPLVSCLVMAPPVTRRAHSMRRLSGAELGTDTDRNDTRTGTPRNSLDGNGPGSTGGRSHGSSGVQQIPDMGHDANQRQDPRDDPSGRFAGLVSTVDKYGDMAAGASTRHRQAQRGGAFPFGRIA